MMSHTENRILLEQAINDVFSDRFRAEKINSERALQSALYASLSRLVPRESTVLVEPTIHQWDPDNTALWGARPDLVVVRTPQGQNEGEIQISLEIKFRPAGDVVFEEDLDRLVDYRACRSMTIKYGIDLGNATERHAVFRADPVVTTWAFVAVGQHASAVATDKIMHKKRESAKGIMAACLVANSPGSINAEGGPYFWITELGGGPLEQRKCISK